MTTDMRCIEVTASTVLVTETCCNCGVLFAMPDDLRDKLLGNRGPGGRHFWCPNGHEQWYLGKSEAQLQRERADGLARRLEGLHTQLTHEADQRQAAERSARALKAVNTRTRRRIADGVCPCCRRSFTDLARHMSSQHPNYAGSDDA